MIDPGDLEVCRREDGSEWTLGSGAYGTVLGPAELKTMQICYLASDTLKCIFELWGFDLFA